MSHSSYLFGQAAVKAMTAQRCRQVAHELDTRRAALTERHQPVVALHNEDVWKGRAALASRQKLRRVIGAGLYYLGIDLATTSRALHGQAVDLDLEAAALRRQGRALAESEARAAAESQAVARAGDGGSAASPKAPPVSARLRVSAPVP